MIFPDMKMTKKWTSCKNCDQMFIFNKHEMQAVETVDKFVSNVPSPRLNVHGPLI